MQYQIIHSTTYTYDRPVVLSAHTLRLQPRSDVTQKLLSFELEARPEPTKVSANIDLDGNATLKVWFPDKAVTSLAIKATSQVETYRTKPFDYLLEPWAVNLPIDYPASLLTQLQPYLVGQFLSYPGPIDPIAFQLSQAIWQETGGSTVSFLSELNQRIHQTCGYKIRETGSPLPAGVTWSQEAGSCRDFAVLMIEACRSMGLAARFVSGYQEGDPDASDRHLHAWAEVYLPGAGWRAYDPTHGLAVGDRHIAVYASPVASQTAPVSGSLKQGGGVQSEMTYQLSIQPIS